MLRRPRALLTFSGLLALTATFGCGANAELEYNNFKERDMQVRPDPTGGGINDCMAVPAAGEADGDYFMAVAPGPAPDPPLVFIATLSTAESPDGLALTFSLQPLDKDDRITPVDDPFELTAVVRSNGAYETEPTEIELSAEASTLNTYTLVENVIFSGSLCAPTDFLCGTMEGQLVAPGETPLPGSTFAMVPVSSPDDYPDPPPINCEGTTAKTRP